MYAFYVCRASGLNFPMSASLMYFQPSFLMFQLNFLKLFHHLCVETAIWEDRLQQGHVQQVDKSGQGPWGWPQDIQDCRCSIIPAFCCHLFWLRSVFSLRCVFFDPQVESIDDQVREKLLLVLKGNSTQLEEKEKNELKKRKLLSEV